MEEDAQRVQAATANFLTCVCDMMKVRRTPYFLQSLVTANPSSCD